MIDLNINETARYIEDDLDLTAHLDSDRHCEHCGEAIAEYGEWLHDDTGEAACADGETNATPGDSLPANWAGITTNTADESVQVQISVGDPRGCLTMTVRRVRDEDGNERLLLHVPNPDDSTPHVTMREIAPGTYVVGEG